MQVQSWHPCPHIPGCIVVNVGDSLQALSDGKLLSNYHRVRLAKPGEPQVCARHLFTHWLPCSCLRDAPRIGTLEGRALTLSCLSKGQACR